MWYYCTFIRIAKEEDKEEEGEGTMGTVMILNRRGLEELIGREQFIGQWNYSVWCSNCGACPPKCGLAQCSLSVISSVSRGTQYVSGSKRYKGIIFFSFVVSTKLLKK